MIKLFCCGKLPMASSVPYRNHQWVIHWGDPHTVGIYHPIDFNTFGWPEAIPPQPPNLRNSRDDPPTLLPSSPPHPLTRTSTPFFTNRAMGVEAGSDTLAVGRGGRGVEG